MFISAFSDQVIWPRGFPLEFLQIPNPTQIQPQQVKGLIVQDLADENPDVDAVYRLTRPLPFWFAARSPVMLKSGTWCPFKQPKYDFSQSCFFHYFIYHPTVAFA